MQLSVAHRTVYRYEEPVKYSAQKLRLTPRRDGGQRVLSWSIHAPGRRAEQLDAHGNVTHLLTLDAPHREIAIFVTGTVETAQGEDLMRHEGGLSPLAYVAATGLTTPSDGIIALAEAHLERDGVLRRRLYDLAAGVCEKVRYRPGTTNVDDPAAAALARGEGVCQDQAHVFLACCRSAGIPARYVSGYLCMDPTASEESASHAWVEVWLSDANGWHGIDVTHVAPAGTAHCRLAVGRDYLDAGPIRGVRRGGGEETMDVRVTARTGEGQ